jgi:transcriptional repressor NrdR
VRDTPGAVAGAPADDRKADRILALRRGDGCVGEGSAVNTTYSSYTDVVHPQVVFTRTGSVASAGGDRVFCPYCRNPDSRVMDSRTADDGAAIRRRRACPSCGRRFTTQETVILMVAKRSGATEPFTREKIVNGVRRACQGRPVTDDQLAILAQQVEDEMRSRGCAEVSSHEVGLAILRPLQELDEVAYMRFASVYRGFESLADFEEEIVALRSVRNGAGRDDAGVLTP